MFDFLRKDFLNRAEMLVEKTETFLYFRVLQRDLRRTINAKVIENK